MGDKKDIVLCLSGVCTIVLGLTVFKVSWKSRQAAAGIMAGITICLFGLGCVLLSIGW